MADEKKMAYNNSKTVVYEIQENGRKEGPFCANCWDKDQEEVLLKRRTSSRYECPRCNVTLTSIY